MKLFSISLLVILAGCAVGPDYKRPASDVPASYRQAGTNTMASGDFPSMADVGWWQQYTDPQLSAYIAEALTNNWDIKIAAARVMQAEAALKIARSEFFPTVNAGGDFFTAKKPQARDDFYGDIYAAMPAYELDIWGKIRRANEAARARLLATKDAQDAVRQTLVASVATSYLRLLELDLELQIARNSYTNRLASLTLTKSREEGGIAALQDVRQAETLVYTTEAATADILRRSEQTENEVNILLGRNPGAVKRGVPLVNMTVASQVPAGLPSSLIERRPDIRAAEELLRAANADIGQAKAAFFPQVTITGLYGYQSVSFSDLWTRGAKTWQFGPTVTFPLFTGGRLQANLAVMRARFDEALAKYQATVQNAFREVSDALIAYERSREFRIAQEKNAGARRSATELANIRYEGGVTSYLEVLLNEQELFTAELTLAKARLEELLSVVQLYRALGGGWQQPELAKNEVKP
jgi:multidrug efflux system outer membrane protein